MASANQGKVTFISYKLTFLKDQRDRLISAVGLYVNRLIAEGETWKQGGDNIVGYQELCQKIDTAVEFLCEKCEELADGSVSVGANQLSCEQLGLTSQSTTPTTTTSATSWRQHTSPSASTARAESVQPADEAQLRPVLAKIAVIEEALYSFRSKTEKVAEQQSGIEQQLKELLSRVAESDKKQSSRFKQMKQQISDMQDAIEQEQKTRLQGLEKQLQEISTTQNKLKGDMESQAEVVAKLVYVPNQMETVKENLDAIDDRIDRIILDCSTRHEELTTEMRGLTGKVKANSDQLISEGQAKETTLLRELETRLQTLEADGGRTVKEVQKQAEKGEAKFRVLCQIVSDRLRPLEQLRTCLNERASQRDDNITKLSQVIQEVAVMSSRLQQLDEAQLRPVLAKIAVIEEAMCSFRSRTEKVAEQQSGIEQQLEELLSRVSESDKKQSSMFTQMKQQISNMKDAIEQEQKTRLQSLEKQLQKISTTQNKLKVEMESQAEIVAKLVHVPNQLENVKENVDAIDARINRIVLDCSKRHEDITTEMRGLTGKIKANSDQLISENQAKKTTLLKELETRLQTLEADGGRTVKEVQKQAEKGEAKLSQVIQEVAVMSPRLHQLELNSSGAVCGFSAHKWITQFPQDTIKQYKIKYSNVGKNFDADSGMFTAAVDGRYVVSISVWLSENEELLAGVKHKRGLNQSESALVCQVLAETKGTPACRVGVVCLKAGEVLFSFVDQVKKNYYGNIVSFSCFLLK